MSENKIDEKGYHVIELEKEPDFFNTYNIKFFFDNKSKFFKQHDGVSANIYTELVANKIGEKLGLNMLKIKPAVYKNDFTDIYGIVSNSYIGENEIRINYKDLQPFTKKNLNDCVDYDEFITVVKKYLNYEKNVEGFDIKLDKNFYKDLQNIIFFDFLIFQSDRSARNIEFILKKINDVWQMSVAPIYDNSLTFCIMANYLGDLNDNYLNVEKEAQRTKFMFAYDNKFSFDGFVTSIKKRFVYNQNYQKMAIQAYNIDINNCFEEIEKENPNFTFDFKVKKIIRASWQITKEILQKQFDIQNYLSDYRNKDNLEK